MSECLCASQSFFPWPSNHLLHPHCYHESHRSYLKLRLSSVCLNWSNKGPQYSLSFLFSLGQYNSNWVPSTGNIVWLYCYFHSRYHQTIHSTKTLVVYFGLSRSTNVVDFTAHSVRFTSPKGLIINLRVTNEKKVVRVTVRHLFTYSTGPLSVWESLLSFLIRKVSAISPNWLKSIRFRCLLFRLETMLLSTSKLNQNLWKFHQKN